MFNVGGGEILVIALIALIAVGPEQLPGVIRKIGNFVGQARQMSGALRTEFMSGMDSMDAGIKELDPTNWVEDKDRGDGSSDKPIVPRGYAERKAAGEPDNPFAPLPGTPGGEAEENAATQLNDEIGRAVGDPEPGGDEPAVET